MHKNGEIYALKCNNRPFTSFDLCCTLENNVIHVTSFYWK
jgi:hypothetical protein